MSNSFLVAILAGLGAMLGWGISDFFAKKSVDKVGSVVFIFWLQLISLISLAFYIPFSNQWQNYPYEQWPKILILVAINLLATYLFYKALEKGKVSIISPINASYPVFAIPISVFFFHEQISSGILILLVTIIVGIILTSLDIKGILEDGFDKNDFNKGVPLVLMNVALLAIWIPFWDDFISDKSWVMSLFIFRVMLVSMFGVFILAKKIKVGISERSTMKWVVISALLFSIAGISFDWGFGTTTHTSLITALSATFPAPTLLLGRIFLKEKLQLTQWFGVGLILLSLVVMGFI
ncbi:DMT family transporter [Patescibacteria group bacterium]|nr:DMT family transporter [Patescibacteria group bacterium]MBU1966885.1 DMT family transporter [Patescibacteria group bacterium]MBU2543223.1 DMT family transporter [Patescibacteria group bacterium]